MQLAMRAQSLWWMRTMPCCHMKRNLGMLTLKVMLLIVTDINAAITDDRAATAVVDLCPLFPLLYITLPCAAALAMLQH